MRYPRLLAGLLTATMLLFPAALLAAASVPAYYRLALTASPPACARSHRADDPAPGRCFGTRPEVIELEMPPDRVVYLDDADAPVPAAWIFAGPLLLHTADLLAPGLGYGFRESASGLRLEIYRGERMLSTAVELDRWLPARTPDGDEIWFLVRRVP